MRAFAEAYLEEATGRMLEVSLDAIERVGHRLLDVAVRGGQVLIAGNGGSASTATHFACDLAKTALGPEQGGRCVRFRAISLTDNAALVTAWANDVGYELIFSEQVKMLGRPGDVLCVISASGSSPSVVEAVCAARGLEIESIGLLGCDGGLLQPLTDDCVVVPSRDFGQIESAHLLVTHLLTAWLRDRLAEHEIRLRAAVVPGSSGHADSPDGGA